MSYPNPQQQQFAQGTPQYQPVYYPPNVYHNSQPHNMNHIPTTPNYSDSALSVYQQPHHLPSTVTHAPHQPPPQAQGDCNVRSDQVQYIPTPPLVKPGVFQNPNPSPFTTTPRTAVQNVSPPPPVRFQCDKCGADFSRSHDRNRHFETTHSDNPPVHKCEICRKQFSRADAKKRHQADGKCVNSS